MTELIARCWLLVLIAFVGGCATYGQDKLFEKDPKLDATIKGTPVDPALASIFILRPKPLLATLTYVPILPVYCAVNGMMLSVMPLGTYVHVMLPPGTHRFTAMYATPGDALFPPKITGGDVTVNLAAGQRHFVAMTPNFGSANLRRYSDRDGVDELGSLELAKVLYAPYTLDTFKARFLEPRRREANSTPSKPIEAQGALPSTRQVSDFFEGLATLAFVALFVVASVAAAKGAPAVSQPSYVDLATPPAYFQPDRRTNGYSVRTSSGMVSQVGKLARETTLRNDATGITYTISGDAIRGSDGSRYRVSGSNVFSDRGDYYQKIGTSIFGSDGSSCDAIGSQLICRASGR